MLTQACTVISLRLGRDRRRGFRALDAKDVACGEGGRVPVTSSLPPMPSDSDLPLLLRSEEWMTGGSGEKPSEGGKRCLWNPLPGRAVFPPLPFCCSGKSGLSVVSAGQAGAEFPPYSRTRWCSEGPLHSHSGIWRGWGSLSTRSPWNWPVRSQCWDKTLNWGDSAES